MDFLERRYMRSPKPAKPREETELHRELLALGIFSVFAITLAIDTLAGARLDFLLAENAKAAAPTTEEEMCANLDRYSNGSDYEAYCAGL